MASTLRLPEDLDMRVSARAAREKVSKHAVLVKIVEAHVDDDIASTAHREAVRRTAEQLMPRWQGVLDTLGNS